MNYLSHIFTDIPIMIVIVLFVTFTIYCFKKYLYVNRNLVMFLNFLNAFNKNDLSFRFREFDEWMRSNPYLTSVWLEFKNTLVFSESVALKSNYDNITYSDVSSSVQNLHTTVDPLYFFNEETLVNSKYNNRLMNSISTILTGCGPLFTFLNIAIAFGKIDFSTQEQTIASVSGLMSSMQVAALVSVFAVGFSLIFIIFEKLTYSMFCKSVLDKIEDNISRLFENISSEKFLFELLRETKIQNNNTSNLIESIPQSFKTALNAGIASNLVPYLENLIFGLNQLNKQLKENCKNNASDEVDDLF